MTEEPVLLTLHDGEEERTYRFATLAERDAFVEGLRKDGIVDGPLIGDDKFQEYMARKEEVLARGGFHVDVWNGEMKYTMSEEAYQEVAAKAQAAGLDVQTFMQQALDKTVEKMFPRSGLSRQQRRHRERQAKKKAKSESASR